MFRHVVLGLLGSGVPQHGYALMRSYRERVGATVSSGNFYRELQRLVAEGLVATAARREDDDPRRAPYAITDAGRLAFRNWFTDTSHLGLADGRDDEFAWRLMFLSDVGPAEVRVVLEHIQERLWSHAKALERARAKVVAAGAGLPVLALTIGRRIRRVAAELAFLDDLRAQYEEWLAAQEPAGRRSRVRRSPIASSESTARRAR
jgi:DNA-binding PadR family transcriptional regulator